MRVVRWIAGTVLVVVLAVEVVLLAPSLRDAWQRLGDVSWWWVAASITAQALSMSAFGRLQRTLLTAAKVPVRQRDSTAVVYAANALSVSLPGGPLFSTTFTYRQTRKWGASPVVASWQLAMSGVLATGTLAMVAVTGGLLAGSSSNFAGLVTAIVLALVLILGVRLLVTRPGLLVTMARPLFHGWNAVRGQPADKGMERIGEILSQLEAVQLRVPDLLRASWWALANWIADVACLWAACLAAGANPSVGGVLIAFTAGKIVSSVPLLPGGLGIVDGTLTATLVAAGLPAVTALPAVVVYRLISFPLVAAAGWLVFAVLFRSTNLDPEHDDPESDAPA